MNPDGTNQRQLTVDLAPVGSVDATGDGRSIAWESAGVVSVRDVDGSDLRRITPDDGTRDYGPVFAPDGRALIVARRTPSGDDAGFWWVPLDGGAGDPRQVLPSGAPEPGSAGYSGDPTGTPWSARVAFDPGGTTALVVSADSRPWLIPLGEPGAPAEPIQLGAAGAPTWSAARHGFVLAAARDGEARMVHSISTSGVVGDLPGTGGADGVIAVSPDGSLAVAIVGDATPAIVVVAPSGATTRLAAGAGPWAWPGFSPDGRSLLATRGDAGIWLLDVTTGAPIQLSTDGTEARWIP